MNESEKNPWRRSVRDGLILLATMAFVGSLGVSLIREHALRLFPPTTATPTVAQAEAWRDAIRGGREDRARLLAAQMVPDDVPELPDPDYLAWMMSFGLGSRPLTEPFHRYDFQRWADASLAEDILARIAPADAPTPSPEAILAAILDRVAFSPDAPTPGPSSNSVLWSARIGNGQDLIRLFSLVLPAAGFHVQVVAAHDEMGNVLHWFCEVRTADGVWAADPAAGWCRAGVDVAALLAAPPGDALSGLSAELRQQIRFISFHLPAELSDYRVFEQRLATALRDLPGFDSPHLGGDPRQRILAWRQTAPPPATPHFTYWRYPVETVLADPACHPAWRLPSP
jgi:hypothetical protein